MVSLDGAHRVQSGTAGKFNRLRSLLASVWPGRTAVITSTTGGRHASPSHASGRAIDFVVPGMSRQESVSLERMCRQVGFRTYNEYLRSSKYKTGDHMHVEG